MRRPTPSTWSLLKSLVNVRNSSSDADSLALAIFPSVRDRARSFREKRLACPSKFERQAKPSQGLERDAPQSAASPGPHCPAIGSSEAR